MPRLVPLALACAAILWPSRPAAQVEPYSPTGLTLTATLGGGAELGLDRGRPGIAEAEVAVGFESQRLGLRAELATVLGLEPDAHVALRPGIRWSIPGVPLQLRVAADAANPRDRDFRWRWLLVGVAAEVRLTRVLGLFAEMDTGAPLTSGAGLPLLFRGGASLRL